jgi:SAM-dependent methyltransferase
MTSIQLQALEREALHHAASDDRRNPLAPCGESGWRSQFGAPRGALGWLAGALMARKNAELNRAAVELLQVRPEHRVLELGFGHGRTVAWLAERSTRGFVAGVDPSPVLTRQASRRNARAIRSGRVRLDVGRADCIPHPTASFDRVLAVNCVQHWDDLPASLEEVLRVLAPAGVLLIGLRTPDHDAPLGGRFSAPGYEDDQIAHLEHELRRAGFICERQLQAGSRTLVALLARPEGPGS